MTGASEFGVAFVDTSTSHFYLCGFQDDASKNKLETLLVQIQPREIIYQKVVTRALVRALINIHTEQFVARDRQADEKHAEKECYLEC